MNLNRAAQIARGKRKSNTSSTVYILFRKITTLFACCFSTTCDNKVHSEECAYKKYKISEKESTTETCSANSEKQMDVFNDHNHINDISKISFEKRPSKNQWTSLTKHSILREETEKVGFRDIGPQSNIEKCDELKTTKTTYKSKVTGTVTDNLNEESLEKYSNQKHQGS